MTPHSSTAPLLTSSAASSSSSPPPAPQQLSSSLAASPPSYKISLTIDPIFPSSLKLSSNRSRVKLLNVVGEMLRGPSPSLEGTERVVAGSDHQDAQMQQKEMHKENGKNSTDRKHQEKQHLSQMVREDVSTSDDASISLLIDTQHESRIPISLSNINIPYLIKYTKMPRYLVHEKGGDAHYGIVRVQVQNGSPIRERVRVGLRLLKEDSANNATGQGEQVGKSALSIIQEMGVSILMERQKLIGDADESWIALSTEQKFDPLSGNLSFTRLIENVKGQQDELVRFQVMRDGQELGHIGTTRSTNSRGTSLHWKDLREGLKLELSDSLKNELDGTQFLEVFHVEKRDVIPFTKYFQSGARLNVNFAVDCSCESTASDSHQLPDRLSAYTSIINNILRQFIPYTASNDRIDVEAFGTHKNTSIHLASTSVDEWDDDLQLNAGKMISADWRTFSAVLEHAVEKASKHHGRDTSKSVPDYSVLFILTHQGECRIRKAYNELVKASYLPLSVIFVGMDHDTASDCNILLDAVNEGVRMSEDGTFPFKKREFCAYIPVEESSVDDGDESAQHNADDTQLGSDNMLHLQRKLFYCVLSHIENYMDAFDMDPQPEPHNKEFNARVDELKRCLRLVKPKKVETPVAPSPTTNSSSIQSVGEQGKAPPNLAADGDMSQQIPQDMQHYMQQHGMFHHLQMHPNMPPPLMHLPQNFHHQMPPPPHPHQMIFHPHHHQMHQNLPPPVHHQMMHPPPHQQSGSGNAPFHLQQMGGPAPIPQQHFVAPDSSNANGSAPNTNFVPPHTITPPPSFFQYPQFGLPPQGGNVELSQPQNQQDQQQFQQQQFDHDFHQQNMYFSQPPQMFYGQQQQPNIPSPQTGSENQNRQ